MVYLMEGLRGSPMYAHAADISEVHWVMTANDNRVPVVWVKCGPRGGSTATASSAEHPPIVLLHCHGNATDIGMMMGPYYELAEVLGIDVVGVEYSGYGTATGTPSSGNTYADVEAAYDLVESLGVPPSRIVAYGQSVGSGPVARLAASRQLGGAILHSPLLSGIKVVDPQPNKCCRPSCVWHCFDFYPNDRRIQDVSCPVFIMHGQQDDIIPFYHGYQLHKDCPDASRWPAYFPAGAGHNDLVETDIRAYFAELSGFLNGLKSVTESPEQIEMAASPSGNAMVEPMAGPEDGRYEHFRQGTVCMPAGLGRRQQQRTEGASQPDATFGQPPNVVADP